MGVAFEPLRSKDFGPICSCSRDADGGSAPPGPGEEAVAYTVTDDAAPIFQADITPRSAPCGAPLQPAVLVCV